MQFSPYFLLIAIGCFGGAALMFTRFRDQAAITYPTGVLLILGGVYLLCREFVRGFAGSQAARRPREAGICEDPRAPRFPRRMSFGPAARSG